MYFTLRFLASKLNQEDILSARYDRTRQACSGVRLWEEKKLNIRDDCIYLFTKKTLLKCISENISLPEHIICSVPESAGEEISRSLEKSADEFEILLISDVKTESEWLDFFWEIMYSYTGKWEQLVSAVISEEPLEMILDLCEDLMENPVCLYDANLRFLGQSSMLTKGFVPNQYWTTSYIQQHVDIRILHNLINKGVMKEISDAREPVLIDLKDGAPPYMTGNIYRKEGKVGSMSVFAANRELSEVDGDILRQITFLIAGRVKNEAYRYELNYTKNQQIILDLMQGKAYPEKVVQKAFTGFKVDIRQGVCLMILRLGTENAEYGLVEYMKMTVEKNLGYCIKIQIKDSICFLYNQYKESEWDIYRELKKDLARIHMKCGCSLIFYDWNAIHQQYLFAEAALDNGEKLRPDQHIYFYRDYAAYHLCSLCEKQTNLRLLCLPDIWKLYLDDRQYGGSKVESLYMYLLCGKSISQAAEKLNIHKTTLGYRLKKIEDMVHLDLKDPMICQQVIFSCQIVTYLIKNNS